MYLDRFFGEFFSTIRKSFLLILISYGVVFAELYFYRHETFTLLLTILATISLMLVLIGTRQDVSLSWKYLKTVIGRTLIIACNIVLLLVLAGIVSLLTGAYWIGLLLLPVIFSFNSSSIYITIAMTNDDIRFLPLKDGYWLANLMLAVIVGFLLLSLKTFILFSPVMAATIILMTLIYFTMGKISYNEGLRVIHENGPPLPKFARKKTTLIEKFILLMEHHAKKGQSY